MTSENNKMQAGLLIEARGIHKKYVMHRKTLEILRGADISVKAGEKVAIVGRSGAGKSTLLHILGGLDTPDAGRVLLAGEDVYGVSSSRRTAIRGAKIGFIFQSYNLLQEMDVIENVMLAAMAGSMLIRSRREMRARAMKLLDAVGVSERASHTPLELSGGEQQRVAIARALMNEPMIVLADEPTGNLDDKTGRQVLDLLFSLSREGGHSLVLVTHNEKVAESCDRVFRLKEGMLVQDNAAS
jgi:putative ABC transport system ATP-binding protein